MTLVQYDAKQQKGGGGGGEGGLATGADWDSLIVVGIP